MSTEVPINHRLVDYESSSAYTKIYAVHCPQCKEVALGKFWARCSRYPKRMQVRCPHCEMTTDMEWKWFGEVDYDQITDAFGIINPACWFEVTE